MSIFKKASVMPIVRSVISQGLDDYNNPDPGMEDAELYDSINKSWEEKIDNKAYYDFEKLPPQKQFVDELIRLQNYYTNVRNFNDSNDFEEGIAAGLEKAIDLADKYLRN
jgi:hypothetical protein